MILTALTGLVIALGASGAVRASSAKDRFEAAAARYTEIMSNLSEVRGRLSRVLESVGDYAVGAIKSLRKANLVLEPLKQGLTVPSHKSVPNAAELAIATLDRSSLTLASYGKLAVVGGGVGLGVGSAVAVGSWAAVSALGTASTGTAIASLHGVAATNAILASLGHGTLAAGSAGMLGGKLALGGIVLLPAAAIMGVMAHAKAGEINEKAREIEEANCTNSRLLTDVKTQLPNFDRLLSQIGNAASDLETSVAKSHEALFKYGIFSRVLKRIRLWVRGYYYTPTEMAYVEELRAAIDRFLHVIGADKGPAGGPSLTD
jgi:ElaB/YqjD/DUF883 family membrane-anchored ribosome-binding protein